MRKGNMKKSSMEMSTGEQEGGESLLKRGEKGLGSGYTPTKPIAAFHTPVIGFQLLTRSNSLLPSLSSHVLYPHLASSPLHLTFQLPHINRQSTSPPLPLNWSGLDVLHLHLFSLLRHGLYLPLSFLSTPIRSSTIPSPPLPSSLPSTPSRLQPTFQLSCPLALLFLNSQPYDLCSSSVLSSLLP